MANTNTISATGTFTVNINNVKATGPLSMNLQMSGSNRIFLDQNIATGSWQALNTSSLSDLRMAYFLNGDEYSTSSVILVATDSAGTKQIAALQPNDTALIPWSGSMPTLYAKAVIPTNSGSMELLTYILVEK